jgi:hypothetical protein
LYIAVGKKPMPLGSIPVVLAGHGRNGSGLAAYFNKSNYFSNMFYEPKAKNDEKHTIKSGIDKCFARGKCLIDNRQPQGNIEIRSYLDIVFYQK